MTSPTDPQTKLCLVTNFNTSYRDGLFHAIAQTMDTDFLFYSDGTEKYWQKEQGLWQGSINHKYLKGFSIANTRIAPLLPLHLMARRYDAYVKCINGRFALPVTYAMARLQGRPFILWTEVWMKFRTPAHRFFYPITRHIYRNADAIVACGEHVSSFLRDEGVDPDRIFLARQAVDNAFYRRPVHAEEVAHLRRRLGIEDDQAVVLYLGRLNEVKGLPYLVRAFADVAAANDRAVLVIAGTGEELPALRTLADSLGIGPRVRFSGYVDRAGTVAHYAMASVFVLPSVELDYVKETWGLVVNEAFNQGLPVIATDAVGAAAGGLVQDGRTGFVVPQRNAEALANAIGRILTEPELAARMRNACRQVITHWTQESMAESYVAAVAYALRKRDSHQGKPA